MQHPELPTLVKSQGIQSTLYYLFSTAFSGWKRSNEVKKSKKQGKKK